MVQISNFNFYVVSYLSDPDKKLLYGYLLQYINLRVKLCTICLEFTNKLQTYGVFSYQRFATILTILTLLTAALKISIEEHRKHLRRFLSL